MTWANRSPSWMWTGPTTTAPQASNRPGTNDAGGETWEDGKIEISIPPTILAEVDQRVQTDSMGKHTYMGGQAPTCSTTV